MIGATRRDVPRLPKDFVRRDRLIERLDYNAPVAVVRALPGSGKTALVADWLRSADSRRMSPLWVNLTADLVSREEFTGHLGRRMRGAGLVESEGSERIPALVLLDESLLTLEHGRVAVLVLDNIDYLTDPSVITDLVTLVQRHENFRIVACARASHPIETIAASAVPVTEILTEELLFTLEEAHQLAEVMGAGLGDKESEGLHGEVGGWVTPFRLLLDSRGQAGESARRAEEYVRNVTFRSTRDPATIDSLKRLALSERLELDMIRDLAADHPLAVDDALAFIERTGLLERRETDGRIEFTFPPMLRRILRDEILLEPAEARAFHLRLSDWFAARRPEDYAHLAFHHAITAKDFPRAHSIWAQNALTMDMNAPEALGKAMQGLPPHALARYPGFMVTRARARVIPQDSDLDSRMATIRAAVRAADRVVATGIEALPLPDLLYIGTGHLIGLRLRGQLDAAIAYAGELDTHIARLSDSTQSPEELLGWFEVQRALTLSLRGQHDLAIAHYQRAWEHSLDAPARSHVSANASANLAMTFTLRGEAAQARLWIDRHSELVHGTQWTNHLANAGAHIAAGLRAIDQRDEQAAIDAIAVLGDGSSALELWPFVAYLSAQHGLHFGRANHALATLNRAVQAHEPITSEHGTATVLVARARSDLMIATRRGQSARDLLRQRDTANPTLAIPFARLLYLTGETESTRHVAAMHLNNPALSPRDQAELLLLDGAAALRAGEPVDALSRFVETVSLSAKTGVVDPLAALPERDRRALAELQPATAFPATAPLYPDQLTFVELTQRERELINALVLTGSRSEISGQLFVSVNTVKTHLATLYKKLDASTREEALRSARLLGIIR